MKQHFLGWLCRWLNNRGILTHPTPLQTGTVPCRTVAEFVETWRVVPRRLVIWRVRRTLSMVYSPEKFARMKFVSAHWHTQEWPKRGLRWHVTFTAGCQ